MSREKMQNIKSTVEILKRLDEKSLLIIDAGARMLKARADMEESEEGEEGEEGSPSRNPENWKLSKANDTGRNDADSTWDDR